MSQKVSNSAFPDSGLTAQEAERLNSEAWALHSENDSEAFRLAEQAHRLALSIHDEENMRLALRTLAVTALSMGLHAEAFEHATEAAHDAVEGADGINRCALVFDPELIRTEPAPRRPFQGWRYLKPEDAPRDLPPTRPGEETLPPELAEALAEFGWR